MMMSTLLPSTIALMVTLAAAAPELHRRAALPPVIQSAVTLGNATSNLPRIYRDGGGGGMINGQNYIIFSDGIYTTSGTPKDDLSNWANFSSNSLALINNPSDPRSLTDIGTATKGPVQVVPYFYNAGESDSATGIWPNENIVTLCNGACGVTFPVVVSRVGGTTSELYNTGVQFTVSNGVSTVTRPTQKLFLTGEPLYGTFSAVTGIDGYLYMFASITPNSPANGLKLARVPQTAWQDKSQYTYWDGTTWSTTIPAKDHVPSSVFKFSHECFGGQYGPIYGDVFWSNYYSAWMLVYQTADPVCDNNVYMSYSSKLESGWSTPVSIYKMPSAGSYSYSLHAYPTLDSTGKTLALSFTQLPASGSAYYIAWAKIKFA